MKLEDLSDQMAHHAARIEELATRVEMIATSIEAFAATPTPYQEEGIARTGNTLLLWVIGGVVVFLAIFLVIRLGPGAYDSHDALVDRLALCSELREYHPTLVCPKTSGMRLFDGTRPDNKTPSSKDIQVP